MSICRQCGCLCTGRTGLPCTLASSVVAHGQRGCAHPLLFVFYMWGQCAASLCALGGQTATGRSHPQTETVSLLLLCVSILQVGLLYTWQSQTGLVSLPQSPTKPKSAVCDAADLLVTHPSVCQRNAGQQPDHTCEPEGRQGGCLCTGLDDPLDADITHMVLLQRCKDYLTRGATVALEKAQGVWVVSQACAPDLTWKAHAMYITSMVPCHCTFVLSQ